MANLLVLQHAGCEHLGAFADGLQSKRIGFSYIRSFAGQPVPRDLTGADGLIVMGGPMSVYEQDRYPFLTDEIRLIKSALAEEKPILGVCLGSQLLAAALGAPVTAGKKKEIGWHTLQLTPAATADPLWADAPASFIGFHWHGDIFPRPKGAERLLSSNLTETQAFRHGKNAYGFLFHLEITEPMIAEWVQTFAAELQREKLDGQVILQQAKTHLPALRPIGTQVFSRWADLVLRKTPSAVSR